MGMHLVCIRMHRYVSGYLCMYIYGGQSLPLGISRQMLPICFLRHDITQLWTHQLIWAGHPANPRDPSVSASPLLWLQVCATDTESFSQELKSSHLGMEQTLSRLSHPPSCMLSPSLKEVEGQRLSCFLVWWETTKLWPWHWVAVSLLSSVSHACCSHLHLHTCQETIV